MSNISRVNERIISSEIRQNAVILPGKTDSQEGRGLPTRSIRQLTNALQLIGKGVETVKFGLSEGPEVFTATTTLGNGLANMFTFNPITMFWGMTQVMMAAMTAKKAWDRFYGQKDGLTRLLDDIEGGMHAIGSTIQSSQKEIELVKQSARSLEAKYNALMNNLEEINKIVDHGDAEIKAKKAQLEANAKTLLNKMQGMKAQLEAIMAKQSAAMDSFNAAKTQFVKINGLAAKEVKTADELKNICEQITNMANAGSKHCADGVKELTEAQEVLSQWNTEMLDVQQLQVEVLNEAKNIFEASERVEKEVQGKLAAAINQNDLSKDIQKINTHTSRAQEELEVGFVMVEETQEKVKEAQQQAAGMYTRGEVLTALVTTATFSSMGTVPAVAAGLLAMEAMRNKETVAQVAQTAKGIFYGKPAEMKPKFEGLLTFTFDGQSTGMVNAIFGRPSATSGQLKIDLGEGKSFVCDVNFSNAKQGISIKDLTRLNEMLINGMINGSISPERCLSIINALSEQTVDRGTDVFGRKMAEGHFIPNGAFLATAAFDATQRQEEAALAMQR